MNSLFLDEQKRHNQKLITAGGALGAGSAVIGLSSTAQAQTTSPVLDINNEVDNLDTLVQNAIPISIAVIVFMLGALVVGRVMRA